MKILSLDYGSVNIGIAVSDETELIAQALPGFKIHQDEDFLRKIKETISKEKIGKIVLGISYAADGKNTKQTDEILRIKGLLEKELQLRVDLWDESFSSVLVEKNKLNKNNSHSEAARMILQEYLDYKRETLSSKS